MKQIVYLNLRFLVSTIQVPDHSDTMVLETFGNDMGDRDMYLEEYLTRDRNL